MAFDEEDYDEEDEYNSKSKRELKLDYDELDDVGEGFYQGFEDAYDEDED